MPYQGEGWIRVTHPCAGRQHQVLLPGLLPLDLHVLSLPLAFILSQDQTLHCKNCLFYLFDSSSCPTSYTYYIRPDTRYLFLLIRFNVLFLLHASVSTGGKRMQKYNLFPNWQNIFLIFFENNTQDAVGVAIEE